MRETETTNNDLDMLTMYYNVSLSTKKDDLY